MKARIGVSLASPSGNASRPVGFRCGVAPHLLYAVCLRFSTILRMWQSLPLHLLNPLSRVSIVVERYGRLSFFSSLLHRFIEVTGKLGQRLFDWPGSQRRRGAIDEIMHSRITLTWERDRRRAGLRRSWFAVVSGNPRILCLCHSVGGPNAEFSSKTIVTWNSRHPRSKTMRPRSS